MALGFSTPLSGAIGQAMARAAEATNPFVASAIPPRPHAVVPTSAPALAPNAALAAMNGVSIPGVNTPLPAAAAGVPAASAPVPTPATPAPVTQVAPVPEAAPAAGARPDFHSYIPQGLARLLQHLAGDPRLASMLQGGFGTRLQQFGITPEQVQAEGFDPASLYTRQMARKDWRAGNTLPANSIGMMPAAAPLPPNGWTPPPGWDGTRPERPADGSIPAGWTPPAGWHAPLGIAAGEPAPQHAAVMPVRKPLGMV